MTAAQRINRWLFSAMLVIASATVAADDPREKTFFSRLAEKNLFSRFIELNPVKQFVIPDRDVDRKISFGQSEVAGEYGYGFVVDDGDLMWSVNHRGIAFTKRF